MTDRLTGARALGTAAGAYAQGFARVAAVTFPIRLADPTTNAGRVIEQARECDRRSVAVAVFTELCLTGYALDDLVLQDAVLDGVDSALRAIAEASADLLPVLVVGAPLRHGNRLYNCAVVIHRGHVLGVAPKSYLPTYREFYERRWYAPGDDQRGGAIVVAGQSVPFGPELLFEASDVPGLVLHAEVCEDMWVPVPPSAEAALAGATVLANLSGSPITIGRSDDRRLLAKSASQRCLAAYVYAAAGMGESSNDLSWDGETMIYETGALLAATERFPDGPRIAVADVDVESLRQERLRQGTFDDNRRALDERVAEFRRIPFELNPPVGEIGLERAVARYPFVPSDAASLAQDCYEAYNIQVSGLEQRVNAIGGPKLVIGVSGGLDSTHALLVCAQAMDRLGRPRSDILAFTMPGFATSDETKANAHALGRALGVTFEELDIRPAANELLLRIGHPYAGGEPVYDVTFENVQAGLRTDFLFRLANQRGGIVVGTGDLSEFALGWATYGVGDQMSHYAVNTGVPKTLMQHLIRWVSGSGQFSTEVSDVLDRVVATEITPELVPVGEDGVAQSTEKTIGPYALHDFALFHVLRLGARPSRIAWLASRVWADASAGSWPPAFPDDARVAYSNDEVVDWLEVFLRRFFGFAQFKRSAMPNGPKVAAGGSLSPRGDWRAPSDSSPEPWLAELHSAFPRG
ncbi:NAD(+) synthase [Gryllotalpicola reticulitermitis]|uniref:Glutamine-dependent NAD(+) synthetase n=1 Tax=Gryllotalpicola reticulitermitis TaxID=1184153 RepID=A0ABV8Q395_9MICO